MFPFLDTGFTRIDGGRDELIRIFLRCTFDPGIAMVAIGLRGSFYVGLSMPEFSRWL